MKKLKKIFGVTILVALVMYVGLMCFGLYIYYDSKLSMDSPEFALALENIADNIRKTRESN